MTLHMKGRLKIQARVHCAKTNRVKLPCEGKDRGAGGAGGEVRLALTRIYRFSGWPSLPNALRIQ